MSQNSIDIADDGFQSITIQLFDAMFEIIPNGLVDIVFFDIFLIEFADW